MIFQKLKVARIELKLFFHMV